MQNARIEAVVDKFEIIEVSMTSLHCRDAGDWPGLARCFLPEARVTTSWFDGTAAEFTRQSSAMMAGHHPNDTQRHMMSNPLVRLSGERAVCEFYVILHQGRTMDGYQLDLQTFSVDLDLFAKRDGEWRIAKRVIIYEKDHIAPHVPGAVPQSYFDQLDLSPYPAAIRYHCYRNHHSSGQLPKNLILKGSPEERVARQAARDWLAG